ncbi:putative two component sensor kinase [Nostocoides japonicum T1-X7]|uniref:Oxygen sensor histidine kinase NreB n=1 Tax=Nostocoides japonicum T1-X7 TaxID=1194083 RepID=A0A077M2T5_9MICO|nr:sensor histidine kinase [Tetrasphaera japonica]CCH78534.1 putative two component sensor kinase [Tetrasphaera japonica T1-X7]
MPHTTLGHLYAAVRLTLHALFAALVAFAVGRAVLDGGARVGLVIATAAVLLLVYLLADPVAQVSDGRPWPAPAWLAVLSALWMVLLALTPDAAYLVFPLFFLYLHLLRTGWALGCVGVATLVAIVGLAAHDRWTVGGVVGPLVAATVAVVVGLTLRAMAAQQAERAAILAELIATRDELAASERRAGALGERARLAREIHDTVAQGLSSIQLLLHAAERADPDGPGVDAIRRARASAGDNLTEIRRIIRELAPRPLEEAGLAGALHRLGAETTAVSGIPVTVEATDDLDLPTETQTALLRIAQGAVSNVVRHSAGRSARIRLTRDADEVVLQVSDDGHGFDAERAARHPTDGDSFGLRAIRERVDQLSGRIDLDVAPDRGTTLTVRLPGVRTST